MRFNVPVLCLFALSCPSPGGEDLATLIVEVRPDRVDSWDRGFDAAGEQVWGAEDGPYVLLRKDQEAENKDESR